MGNVFAAGPATILSKPSQSIGTTMPELPPPEGLHSPANSGKNDSGLGNFEDLNKKCKDLFPVPFEGAKLLVNKGLSNHFQVSHTLTMSSLQPSGYRFGCTYVGTRQYSPAEAYPILIGDIDPSGNMNANIIHQVTANLRAKFVAQIQGGKWVATQLTSETKGSDFTASFTVGNPDFINGSGVAVVNYLQQASKRLALGAELLYQYGPSVPGSHIAVYTLGGRYSGENWQAGAKLTPMAGALNAYYYQNVSDTVQVGVELDGSLRTRECTATLGYQVDLPSANLTFRGQLDSNYCVSAVMEKKLPPLPFTFALSAFTNHVKGSYRFGIGLIVG